MLYVNQVLKKNIALIIIMARNFNNLKIFKNNIKIGKKNTNNFNANLLIN